MPAEPQPPQGGGATRALVSALNHGVLCELLKQNVQVVSPIVDVALCETRGIKTVLIVSPHEVRPVPDAWLADLDVALGRLFPETRPGGERLTPTMKKILSHCRADTPTPAARVARRLGKSGKSSYVRTLLARLVRLGFLRHERGGYVRT